MRLNAAATLVALMCGVVSCSRGEAAPDPASELASALRATLAADSFAVSSTVRYEGKVFDGEVRYVAPDRYTIAGEGEVHPTTIGVGRETYFSVTEDPGRYQRMESTCDVPIDGIISFLGVIGEARDVVFVDGSYRFRVPMLEQPEEGGEIEVEATIGGGYLASVRLRYHLSALDTDVEEMHTLHDFGGDFTIEPPSPDRVITESDDGVITLFPTPSPTCPV